MMRGLVLMRSFAAARFTFAIVCVFAPGIAVRMIGESPSGLSAATKSFAALTATRACALGALELNTYNIDRDLRRKMLTMISAVDTIDMITCLARWRGNRRFGPLIAAIPLGVPAVYVHLREAFKN
jgi:hypothetical protein